MKVEKTITEALSCFPKLFQDRNTVLLFLFCTNGNGYDWVDGELVEKNIECIKSPTTFEDEMEKEIKEKFHLRYTKLRKHYGRFRLSLVKFFSHIKGTRSFKERRKAREFTLKFWEKIYQHSLTPDFSEGWSYLTEIPDDIKKDWKQALVETAQYIIRYEEETNREESKTYIELAKKSIDKCSQLKDLDSKIE